MKVLTRRKSTRRFIASLLCLLPLLMVLFSVFRSGVVDIATITSQLDTLMDVPYIEDFYTWVVGTFFAGVSNDYLMFAVLYFIWLTAVGCLDLMFSFFLSMLDLFRSWIDRIGGEC